MLIFIERVTDIGTCLTSSIPKALNVTAFKDRSNIYKRYNIWKDIEFPYCCS